MVDVRSPTYAHALEHFGSEAQAVQAIEELAELTQCLAKWANGRYLPAQNMIEELADAYIMLQQMALLFGPEQVAERVHQKLERLERTIRANKTKAGVEL